MTIHEAKTHLSRLIKLALAGKDVSITNGRSGEVLVKLIPATPMPKRRTPNRFAHLIPPGKDLLEDGFWDPLPDEHLGLGRDGEDLQP